MVVTWSVKIGSSRLALSLVFFPWFSNLLSIFSAIFNNFRHILL